MDFIDVKVQAPQELAEILIAELGELGYSTFMEVEDGFHAYITEDRFSEEDLGLVLEKYIGNGPVEYTTHRVAKQNWNEEWEKNFEPLLINNVCSVRASFHEEPQDVLYDIVINPKMSFGTGHHETTSQMIENQLTLDHKGKRVLDMGCGTGILAIMAKKLGAAKVVAVDIEDWTVENARENAAENGCPDIDVRLGDITAVDNEQPFDIILANINRNVLLQDMEAYAGLLKQDGALVLSGFYSEDLPQIREQAEKYGLKQGEVRTKNNWISAIFTKNA